MSQHSIKSQASLHGHHGTRTDAYALKAAKAAAARAKKIAAVQARAAKKAARLKADATRKPRTVTFK